MASIVRGYPGGIRFSWRDGEENCGGLPGRPPQCMVRSFVGLLSALRTHGEPDYGAGR